MERTYRHSPRICCKYGIYDLDILHFLQYLLTYVRTQSLDGHDVQFLTFKEAFEHIAHGHEVLEGLLFGLEINQYIDVAAWLVFATHRRAEQSQFRHTELQQRHFQFSKLAEYCLFLYKALFLMITQK